MKDVDVIHTTDSYAAVRGLEHSEYLDLGDRATVQNNPISSRNKKKEEYLDCADKHKMK